MVLLLHFEAWYVGKQVYFETCYVCVEFFFILSGFLMMKHFEKDNEISPTRAAMKYTLHHFCALYPYFLLAWGIAFLKLGIENHYSLHKMLSVAKKSVWELLLVWTAAPGNQALVFVAWYVSAMLISGYFIYWLIKRNRELYIGFLAPCAVLLAYSFFARNGCGLDYHYSFNQLLGNCAIRSVAGMSVGCISYCFYKRFSAISFSRFGSVFLNGVEILVIALVFYGLIKETHSNYDFFTALLFSPLIILGFMKKTILSNVLNRKFFGVLGDASIGMYFTQEMLFPYMNKMRLAFALNTKSSYALLIVISTLAGFAIHFMIRRSMPFFREISGRMCL